MDTARLVLKTCPPEDWQILRDLALRTFVVTFAAQNDPDDFQAYVDEAFSPGQVRRELADPEAQFWIAWDGERPAGYLKVNFGAAQTEPMDRPAMEIQRIYVEEDLQGAGVAQALLAKARELAQAAGVEMIWLGVWEQNPKAIRFYQKSGFRKFGEHRFMMGPDEQTDWLMKTDVAVSIKNHLLDTFRFNDRSNRLALQKITALPQPGEAVRLVSHLINSQDKWLARIRQDPAAPGMSWWEPKYPLDALLPQWERSVQAWLGFLQSQRETDLFQPVVFVGYDGGRWMAQLKDIALQLNYHSIHHRAQLQTLFRAQGLEPDFLDYIGTVYQKLS